MTTEHITNLIDHANNNGGIVIGDWIDFNIAADKVIDALKVELDVLFSPSFGPAPISNNDLQGAGPILGRKENWDGSNGWWDAFLIWTANIFFSR